MKKNKYNLKCEDRTQIQRDFHKERIAFLIVKDKIHFIKGVDKSHFELASELGISKEEFDNLCRGFYLNGKIVFYKGHFTYDNEMISIAKKFIPEIKKFCGAKEVEVYCGQIVGSPNEIWPPDFYLGKF
ncbi:MAG: hypothetical protein AB7S44_01610 [Spirochaetales bacterium]